MPRKKLSEPPICLKCGNPRYRKPCGDWGCKNCATRYGLAYLEFHRNEINRKVRERVKRIKELNGLRFSLPVDTQDERWRAVPGFENRYLASSLGRLYSVRRGIYLKPTLNRKGYLATKFWSDEGKHVPILVASAVATAFKGPRPPGYTINHDDTVKINNREDNLEYVTNADNIRHAFRHGLISRPKGENVLTSVLTDTQVMDIRRRWLSNPLVDTQRVLAREFGVSVATTHRIVNGKTWKHLPAK